jgi:hypothetical protein
MADRREQKEALRAKRLEREQAEAAAKRRRRLIVYVVAGLLVLAVVGGAAAFSLTGGGDGGGTAEAGGLPEGEVPARKETNLKAAVAAAGCTLEREESEGDDHVETPVPYRSKPPHSGNHDPIPAEDGAYADPPAQEALVHALEHGRVIVQWRDGTPDEVQGSLKALFDEDPVHMILVPDQSGMNYAVAATAWTDADASGPEPSYGRLLGCPQANPQVYDAIRAFRDAYRDRGPEYVP